MARLSSLWSCCMYEKRFVVSLQPADWQCAAVSGGRTGLCIHHIMRFIQSRNFQLFWHFPIKWFEKMKAPPISLLTHLIIPASKLWGRLTQDLSKQIPTIHHSLPPSIIFHLYKVGLHRQQPKQKGPAPPGESQDVSKAFPGQPRKTGPLPCP